MQHDNMGASFGGGFSPSKPQPKVPFAKPYGTTVLDLIEQGAFANKSGSNQRPESIKWIIKQYDILKEKNILVRGIDDILRFTYSQSPIQDVFQFYRSALGYALKPASQGIIALSNTYDEIKMQYPVVGTIGSGAKIMFDGTLYLVSAFAMPRVTGTITASSIVFPEATGEIMAVGEYLYKQGLRSLNSDLTQREVDALGSATKFAADTTFLKYAFPHALQNTVKGVNATNRFFNPSKVTLYDPRTGSGIIIDIGEGANSLRPFKPEPTPIFQEATPVKPIGGKLIEYKASALAKPQHRTELIKPVSMPTLLKKIQQTEGIRFKGKESIIIFPQDKSALNTLQKSTTTMDEVMHIIRKEPYVFQIQPSTFEPALRPSAIFEPASYNLGEHNIFKPSESFQTKAKELDPFITTPLVEPAYKPELSKIIEIKSAEPILPVRKTLKESLFVNLQGQDAHLAIDNLNKMSHNLTKSAFDGGYYKIDPAKPYQVQYDAKFKHIKSQLIKAQPHLKHIFDIGDLYLQKIIGMGQETGTWGHGKAAWIFAKKMAALDNVELVILDRSLCKWLGLEREGSLGQRPDIIVVERFWDGTQYQRKIYTVEVKSNSDDVDELRIKGKKNILDLPPDMRGESFVLEEVKDVKKELVYKFYKILGKE